MEKKLQDSQLGTILIRTSARARHYNLRVKKGMVIATMPEHRDEQKLRSFIQEKRPQLLRFLSRETPVTRLLNEQTDLQATTFKLHIFCSDRSNYYMKLEKGMLHIACPQQTRFDDEKVQATLRGLLERALRHEAKRVLPVRLKALAEQYHFSYSTVKINNSKTRWGSCSGGGDINLSLSLMLLPPHLVDYVLLHELCHTLEMNHSERFWSLMDQVTAKKAKVLRKELKRYSTL
ncbi:MAG: M48 family metallopeptidase [Tannerellaceae bacterium]|nr:M48 family metallopeptidase [Tannerellaceae bacterium]